MAREVRYDSGMCRLAAYIGPELSLGRFLLDPPHNLVEQSWRPREMTVGHLNADGYGFGWQAPDGTAARLTYPMPIWTDVNLPTLARSLRSGLWLAAVRGATAGFPVHHANTQPFAHNALLFMHNGHIEHFARTVRGAIRRLLDDDIEATIDGTTDSEYVFALLRQIGRHQREPGAVLPELAGTLAQHAPGALLLNIILSDGQRLYALRYGRGAQAPSLYMTRDDPDFPDATLICSEPLTADLRWQAIPAQTAWVVSRGAPPQCSTL